jgi:hypothetical protein
VSGVGSTFFANCSTILYFAHTDKYMILDFRAQWALGIKKPSAYTFEFWMA